MERWWKVNAIVDLILRQHWWYSFNLRTSLKLGGVCWPVAYYLPGGKLSSSALSSSCDLCLPFCHPPHVYIVTFLRRSIYTRVLLLWPHFSGRHKARLFAGYGRHFRWCYRRLHSIIWKRFSTFTVCGRFGSASAFISIQYWLVILNIEILNIEDF